MVSASVQWAISLNETLHIMTYNVTMVCMACIDIESDRRSLVCYIVGNRFPHIKYHSITTTTTAATTTTANNHFF